jgi:hypothetical protein
MLVQRHVLYSAPDLTSTLLPSACRGSCRPGGTHGPVIAAGRGGGQRRAVRHGSRARQPGARSAAGRCRAAVERRRNAKRAECARTASGRPNLHLVGARLRDIGVDGRVAAPRAVLRRGKPGGGGGRGRGGGGTRSGAPATPRTRGKRAVVGTAAGARVWWHACTRLRGEERGTVKRKSQRPLRRWPPWGARRGRWPSRGCMGSCTFQPARRCGGGRHPLRPSK